jgi:hypothetical protein
VIAWSKDLRRSIYYLETRNEIDADGRQPCDSKMQMLHLEMRKLPPEIAALRVRGNYRQYPSTRT